jgi:hypothetical protein
MEFLRAFLDWLAGSFLRRLRYRRVACVPLYRPSPAQRLGTADLVADLDVWLETQQGELRPVFFRVDSGASLSSIGLERAQDAGLSIPPADTALERSHATATGPTVLRLRPGTMRIRFSANLAERPFTWPLLFVEGRPRSVLPLLGLGGVIQDSLWHFEGEARPGAPWGVFLLWVRRRPRQS